jgi:hypothetical protein
LAARKSKRRAAPLLRRLGGGWFRFQPGDEAALLRFRQRSDGRLVVAEMYVAAEDGVTSERLRALPVARAEAAANREVREEVLHESSTTPIQTVEVPIWALRDAEPDGGWVAFEEASGARAAAPRLKLRPSAGSRKRSDAFYQSVADAYTWLAAQTKAPAARLAELNEVPVTTVHQWVKEARRRELLGPGQRGRSS